MAEVDEYINNTLEVRTKNGKSDLYINNRSTEVIETGDSKFPYTSIEVYGNAESLMDLGRMIIDQQKCLGEPVLESLR